MERIVNKPSSVDSKQGTLRSHIVPAIGHLRLDQVTYAVIEDLTLTLSRKPARAAGEGEGDEPRETLTAKSINNALTIVRRMLVIARARADRGGAGDRLTEGARARARLPRLRGADRSLAVVDEDWRTMKAVQELLGHSTIQMTMRYAHVAPQVTRDAVNLLDRPALPPPLGPRTPRVSAVAASTNCERRAEIMVEAAGVEPASENASMRASTRVGTPFEVSRSPAAAGLRARRAN